MKRRHATPRRAAVRQFHVVWTNPPVDEIVIAAGANALRLYAERQSHAQAHSTAEQP